MVDPVAAAELINRLELLLEAVVQEERYGDLDFDEVTIAAEGGGAPLEWRPADFLAETTGSCSDLLEFLLVEAPALRELQMRMLPRSRWLVFYRRNKLRPRGKPGTYTYRSAPLRAHEEQPLVRAALLLMGKGKSPKSAATYWDDLQAIIQHLRAGIRGCILASRRRPGPVAASKEKDPELHENRVLKVLDDGMARTAKETHLAGGFPNASTVRGALSRLKASGCIEKLPGARPMRLQITKKGRQRLLVLLSIPATTGNNGGVDG